MKLRSPQGTRIAVPPTLADRYLARGWVPVGGGDDGEQQPTPAAEQKPAEPVRGTPENPATPDPPAEDDTPVGVVTTMSLGGGVPDGTAKDVLDWVGDDRQRAGQALEVEQGKGDDARSTLVARLTKLAGK
jgi:hypothetical protein